MTRYTVTSVCEGLLTPETEDWTRMTLAYDTASEQTYGKAILQTIDVATFCTVLRRIATKRRTKGIRRRLDKRGV